MKYLVRTFVLLSILWFAACKSGGDGAETKVDANKLPAELKLSWEFVTLGEAEFGAPITKVILKINDKSIVIEEKLQESCNELSAKDFADYKFPSGTLAAFTSWWAGAGYHYYVYKEGEKVIVMRAGVDEAMDENYVLQYEKIKEITATDLK